MRLAAEKLTVERSGRRVLEDVSFEAESGAALIVTGPNGSGKSTLLRALAGFLPLAGGAFALTGGDPELSVGEQAHYLGHLDALKGALTASENLAFWAAMLSAGPSAEGVRAALARVGLAHAADFPVRALSAGQKRRVALARLLVAPRPLWLLDEPTTALDAASQDAFAAIAHAFLASGGLVIAATHAPLGLAGARELRLGGEA